VFGAPPLTTLFWPTYVARIVAEYVPAVAVLNVAVTEQVAPPVAQGEPTKVGAAKPLGTSAEKDMESTPQPNPPQPVPGKVFSAVAVIVAVGEAPLWNTVKEAAVEVIATQAG